MVFCSIRFCILPFIRKNQKYLVLVVFPIYVLFLHDMKNILVLMSIIAIKLKKIAIDEYIAILRRAISIERKDIS